MKTTCHVIRQEIEREFSAEELATVPVSNESRIHFDRLMEEERRLLLLRLDEVEKGMTDKILTSKDYFSLLIAMKKMRENVVIGNYSPLERQRKMESGNY
jgi:hypothetical protein